jgi:hypothetical protein
MRPRSRPPVSQVRVDGVIAQVGFSTDISGYATSQELAPNLLSVENSLESSDSSDSRPAAQFAWLVEGIKFLHPRIRCLNQDRRSTFDAPVLGED